MGEKYSERAAFLCSVQQQMEGGMRGNWNYLWTQVAERVLPNYDDFIKKRADGQKRTERVFESTAPLALKKFCAAMESILCPPMQRYQRLRCTDERYAKIREVNVYLDQVTDCLFAARYAPGSNFQSQVNEYFSQLGAFGTGPWQIHDDMPGIRYECLHLAEVYIMEGANGRADWIHRKYELTTRQAMQMQRKYGWQLPPKIVDAMEREPDRRWSFLHCVYPNEERIPGAMGPKGMAFCSVHIAWDTKEIVKESGFRTQPIVAGRYMTAAKETYGRGPCIDILPDILMVNEMEKTNIRMAQKNVDPPILLADDGALASFSMRSNSLNYNMVNQDGKPMAIPFQAGGNFQIAKEYMDQKRELINDALLVNVFQILVDDREMTATEVMERAQEKAQMLAPAMGRQQAEWLGPNTEREIDILYHANQLPDPPPQIKRMMGGGYLPWKIEYQSEIIKVQKQGPALGILRSLQSVATLANVNPSSLKRINADKVMGYVFDANDCPTDCLYSDDEMKAINQDMAQQQQLQSLAQAAPGLAGAAKDLATAQQTAAQGTPTSAIPA